MLCESIKFYPVLEDFVFERQIPETRRKAQVDISTFVPTSLCTFDIFELKAIVNIIQPETHDGFPKVGVEGQTKGHYRELAISIAWSAE
jgi:hypothetical protein